jgi:3',5'-cyclic AMP phosphodiesterase CpdA
VHVFREFRRIYPNSEILVVPGNHDVWNYMFDSKSDTIFYDVLPNLCKDEGCIWLENENFVYENWLFSGSIMWYDYSSKKYAPGEVSVMPDELFASRKGRYNNDGNYIDWEFTDKEFAKERLDNLLKRIKKGLKQKDVEHLAVFTHVPVVKEAIQWKSPEWNFGSQYFYNLTAGDELLKIKELKLIGSGHTHHGIESWHRNDEVLNLVCPSDYGWPCAYILELHEDGTIDKELFKLDHKF